MVSMTLAIPIELKKEMELYPEINWSVVARAAIQRKIKILQEMDKILSKSELTEENTIRLGRKINRKVAKRFREFEKEDTAKKKKTKRKTDVEKLAQQSNLTKEDVDAFNKKIKASATKRFLS